MLRILETDIEAINEYDTLVQNLSEISTRQMIVKVELWPMEVINMPTEVIKVKAKEEVKGGAEEAVKVKRRAEEEVEGEVKEEVEGRVKEEVEGGVKEDVEGRL